MLFGEYFQQRRAPCRQIHRWRVGVRRRICRDDVELGPKPGQHGVDSKWVETQETDRRRRWASDGIVDGDGRHVERVQTSGRRDGAER